MELVDVTGALRGSEERQQFQEVVLPLARFPRQSEAVVFASDIGAETIGIGVLQFF